VEEVLRAAGRGRRVFHGAGDLPQETSSSEEIESARDDSAEIFVKIPRGGEYG